MGDNPHYLTRKKKGKLARVDSYAAFRDENDGSLWMVFWDKEMHVQMWWNKRGEDHMTDWTWEEAGERHILQTVIWRQQLRKIVREGERRTSTKSINRKVGFIPTKNAGISLSALEKTWSNMSRLRHLRSAWRQVTVSESSEKHRYCWICGTPDAWSHVGPWAHCCPCLDTGGWQGVKGRWQ